MSTDGGPERTGHRADEEQADLAEEEEALGALTRACKDQTTQPPPNLKSSLQEAFKTINSWKLRPARMFMDEATAADLGMPVKRCPRCRTSDFNGPHTVDECDEALARGIMEL